MVTISRAAPLVRPDRERPPNLTGLILCSLLAIPFWAVFFAVIF